MLTRWTRHGFHLQHYYLLSAQAEIDLYEGNPKAAWERVVSGWPAFKKSQLRRNQLLFIESAYLHSRAVLAAAAAGEIPMGRLDLAERDAHQIEREAMPSAEPFAHLIRPSQAPFVDSPSLGLFVEVL